MDTHKVSAIIGFIVLGLSPSFVDWQQAPEKRKQMLAFYTVGVFLIYFGLFAGKK
jgi:uncharacterized membrane protein